MRREGEVSDKARRPSSSSSSPKSGEVKTKAGEVALPKKVLEEHKDARRP